MTGEWSVKADLNFESSTSSVSKKQIFTAKYYWSIWLVILGGISYMNLYDSCTAFFSGLRSAMHWGVLFC